VRFRRVPSHPLAHLHLLAERGVRSVSCSRRWVTTHLETEGERVSVDRHGIFESDGTFSGSRLVSYIPDPLPPEQLSPRPDRPECLIQVRAGNCRRRSVRQLADRVFAGCRSTQERLTRRPTLFSRELQLRLEYHGPGNETRSSISCCKNRPPLRVFRLRSGRLVADGGRPVPLCHRVCAGGIQRIRRDVDRPHRDAHAWVEAYDDATRTWRIVEASPIAAQPRALPPSQAVRFWNFSAAASGAFGCVLQHRGWAGSARSRWSSRQPSGSGAPNGGGGGCLVTPEETSAAVTGRSATCEAPSTAR